MLYFVALAQALRRDHRGVTALEYGLIAGSIALAIVTVVGTLGGQISGVFNSLSTASW